MIKNKIFSLLISLIFVLALIIAGNFIPVLKFLSFIALFLITLILTFKTGKYQGLILTVLSALFSFISEGQNTIYSLAYLVTGTTAVVISELFKKENTFITSIISVAGVFGAYLLALFINESVALGQNAYTFYVNGFIAEYKDVITDAIKMSEYGEYSAVIAEYVESFMQMVSYLTPSVIIIALAVLAFFIIYLSYGVLKLFKCNTLTIPCFSRFKVDTITSLCFFISLIAIVFVKNELLSIVFMNIYTIIEYLLLICALSLIDYALKNKRIVLPLRILILAVILSLSSIPFISLILMVIAITDARRDFRNLTGKRKIFTIINGKPTILTKDQFDEMIKKSKEQKEETEEKDDNEE